MISGRFAPSPTGDLHLGHLRTAVAAQMSARRHGDGRFIVRFEDLDRVTSSRDLAARQTEDLAAVGVLSDEEPVFQSDRFDLYHAAIQSLIDRGLTYTCFCSRREVREASQAPHGAPHEYNGKCRSLTDAEREQRAAERPGALRLDSRAAGFADVRIGFTDAIHGPQSGPIDDLVLRRNDGVPSYNVAVVVDDAAQGITEVLRGDDLLTITPSQIALQRLLGLPTPAYVHVPLVMGTDGERLAKRNGAKSLSELVAAGATAGEIRARLESEVREFLPV